MDDESSDDRGVGQNSVRSEAMLKSGSVWCLPKQTITNAFDSILSCLLFVALLYIGLLIAGLVTGSELDRLFYVIGYISFSVLLIVPLGLYGSSSGSYCALFSFFIAASYLFYALMVYIWFNTRNSALFPYLIPTSNNSTQKISSISRTEPKGFDTLHQLTCCSYTGLVVLSLLLATFKIISNVDQIEPARVIVVDNNPSD